MLSYFILHKSWKPTVLTRKISGKISTTTSSGLFFHVICILNGKRGCMYKSCFHDTVKENAYVKTHQARGTTRFLFISADEIE